MVEAIFGGAGLVTHVNLFLDKYGRSRGMAIVEFNHIHEAIRAIDLLNNQVNFIVIFFLIWW